MERKRFRNLFPHLAEEMENGSSKIPKDNVKSTRAKKTTNTSRKWKDYHPDIVDFIRRCRTIIQTEEVIEYMEGREEITSSRATELRQQLKHRGLESFGVRKSEGYYHRDR